MEENNTELHNSEEQNVAAVDESSETVSENNVAEYSTAETSGAGFVENNQEYCPYCKSPIYGGRFCQNCGALVKTEPAKQKPSKNKALIIIGVILIVLVVALIGYLAATNIFIPKHHYDLGISLMESEDYEEAIDEFALAGNYKNSSQKAEEAKELKEQAAKKKAQEERIEKFKTAYRYCSSSGTTLASDGKSITVDSKNKYNSKSLTDILMIIGTLDLPNSLFDEMASTNSLMGRLTETYDDIQVSWSYHPDNGLDVVFKLVG